MPSRIVGKVFRGEKGKHSLEGVYGPLVSLNKEIVRRGDIAKQFFAVKKA